MISINNGKVTPCVGVWIETMLSRFPHLPHQSHPAWVCGLKPKRLYSHVQTYAVTPCVGVWIETPVLLYNL